MPSPLRTENPLAERRYAYARAAARDRDFAAAAEVLEQTLELDPRWAAAWFALGESRQQLGDFLLAREAFAEALRLDPSDTQGASVRIAALDETAPKALPAAYVARLFDDYAPRFDEHLTRELSYRGPELIAAALDAAAPGRRFLRALDLGCGSGLMAAALRSRVDAIAGVDLSRGMIERARRTKLYDALAVGDVVAFLVAEPEASADLAVAADVFVYLGDLAPVLAGIARTLKPGGLAVFTVEAEAGQNFGLGATLRYRHSRGYVERAVNAAGLAPLSIGDVSTRSEAGAPVRGLIVVARRQRP
ncbi:MAG: methyltransferase domain-containing protein [Roseiarcus sp.]